MPVAPLGAILSERRKLKALAVLRDDLTDLGHGGIDALEVVEPIVDQFGIAVAFAIDLELVEMRVGPAHRCLDVFVELVERAVLNLNPSPDRGFRFQQRDLELI